MDDRIRIIKQLVPHSTRAITEIPDAFRSPFRKAHMTYRSTSRARNLRQYPALEDAMRKVEQKEYENFRPRSPPPEGEAARRLRALATERKRKRRHSEEEFAVSKHQTRSVIRVPKSRILSSQATSSSIPRLHQPTLSYTSRDEFEKSLDEGVFGHSGCGTETEASNSKGYSNDHTTIWSADEYIKELDRKEKEQSLFEESMPPPGPIARDGSNAIGKADIKTTQPSHQVLEGKGEDCDPLSKIAHYDFSNFEAKDFDSLVDETEDDAFDKFLTFLDDTDNTQHNLFG